MRHTTSIVCPSVKLAVNNSAFLFRRELKCMSYSPSVIIDIDASVAKELKNKDPKAQQMNACMHWCACVCILN